MRWCKLFWFAKFEKFLSMFIYIYFTLWTQDHVTIGVDVYIIINKMTELLYYYIIILLYYYIIILLYYYIIILLYYYIIILLYYYIFKFNIYHVNNKKILNNVAKKNSSKQPTILFFKAKTFAIPVLSVYANNVFKNVFYLKKFV